MRSKHGFKEIREAGLETSLRLPKLLVPFPVRESIIRNRDPKTILQAGYNRQSVPVYTRTIANVTAGYAWKGNNWTKHSFNPLSFDVVNFRTWTLNSRRWSILHHILPIHFAL